MAKHRTSTRTLDRRARFVFFLLMFFLLKRCVQSVCADYTLRLSTGRHTLFASRYPRGLAGYYSTSTCYHPSQLKSISKNFITQFLLLFLIISVVFNLFYHFINFIIHRFRSTSRLFSTLNQEKTVPKRDGSIYISGAATFKTAPRSRDNIPLFFISSMVT